MDKYGYDLLHKILKNGWGDSPEYNKPSVEPVPNENEDVRFVSIEITEENMRPDPLLNLLDKAGVLYDPREEVDSDGRPLLEFKAVDSTGQVFLFEDRNRK
jgi:hypothetical protein